MKETQRILDQLKRSFRGDAWHGDSLNDLLKDLDAAQAVTHPLENAHSIWEIVLHISAWMDAVTTRITTQKKAELEGSEDWPPVDDPSQRAWRRTIQDLEFSYGQLIGTILNLDESRLEDITPGRNYSIYVMLHGVIQHTLYHAGQIALLRKQTAKRVAASN